MICGLRYLISIWFHVIYKKDGSNCKQTVFISNAYDSICINICYEILLVGIDSCILNMYFSVHIVNTILSIFSFIVKI